MGNGLIRTSRWNSDLIRIEHQKETRLISNHDAWEMKGKDFLKYANTLLSDSGLFLSEARYKEGSWGGFWPHLLTGQFYQERKNRQNPSLKNI